MKDFLFSVTNYDFKSNIFYAHKYSYLSYSYQLFKFEWHSKLGVQLIFPILYWLKKQWSIERSLSG